MQDVQNDFFSWHRLIVGSASAIAIAILLWLTFDEHAVREGCAGILVACCALLSWCRVYPIKPCAQGRRVSREALHVGLSGFLPVALGFALLTPFVWLGIGAFATALCLLLVERLS